MRLAKYLASAGVASRRASEQIIREGRVAVDGVPVTDPARDVGAEDAVTVDGASVARAAERVVYMLNKPAGVLSTARDPQGRPTVVSLIPSQRRLFPVGRLDADSTGLILLTDDGELAHRLTHPSFEVPKTYRVLLDGTSVREAQLRTLREGVVLQDGLTAPAGVRRVNARTLEITIHEGRKRQVKRMCEAVGHCVLSLHRVQFGALSLGELPQGAHRQLSAAEVAALASAGSAARRSGRTSSAAPARRRAA